MMLETWLIELGKGIGKLFLHPLLYWIIILYLITSYRRIKRERLQFGSKVFDMFAEGRNTLGVSLIFSIIVSIFSIGFGFVFSYEVIIILFVVTLLLSINGAVTALSASYTIGITFLVVMISQYGNFGLLSQYRIPNDLATVQFFSLSILAGLYLLIEAILVSSQISKSFPMLTKSDRGKWVGQHQLKRLAFIPFFGFIPIDGVHGVDPLFPYFVFGDQSFTLIFLPFVIGFHYHVQSQLPYKAAQKIGQATLLLSMIVLAFAIASLFYPLLTIFAIVIAILGREWIMFRHRQHDRQKPAFFTPVNKGVKVLAVYPNSPAERLGIEIGEIILKVNGEVIDNSKQFYEALRNGGPFFKLDILDHQGEVRFVTSAFYEEDHHELGLIFPEKPHFEDRMEQTG